jgi:hypothetical protein
MISARFASVVIAAIIFIAAPVFAQTQRWWSYEQFYQQLARTPETYAGSTVSFSGKVLQVIQDERGGTVLRVGGVSPDGRNEIIYVEYRASLSEPRILEGDSVDVRAKFVGIKSYKAALGNIIQVPHVIACEVKNVPKNNSSIQVLRAPQELVPCDISSPPSVQTGPFPSTSSTFDGRWSATVGPQGACNFTSTLILDVVGSSIVGSATNPLGVFPLSGTVNASGTGVFKIGAFVGTVKFSGATFEANYANRCGKRFAIGTKRAAGLN